MNSERKLVYVAKRKHRYWITNWKRFTLFAVFVFTVAVSLFVSLITEDKKDVKPMLAAEISSQNPTVQTHMYIQRDKQINDIEQEEYQSQKMEHLATDASSKCSTISASERELLERLVEAEAKGESLVGKIAVVNVVLNRVRDEDFPNTITEVIMQKGQFTPVANGSINNTPSEESILAVKKAVDEDYKVFGTDVLYFCNKKTATNRWMIENREEVMTIGNHTFFR
ncbi:MAG: cell wall hydrolase [Clostridiaceae bacterium]|nr:cell wall hydrolase [Clostridiaceae bacterium]